MMKTVVDESGIELSERMLNCGCSRVFSLGRMGVRIMAMAMNRSTAAFQASCNSTRSGRGLLAAINHHLKPHLVHSTFDSCRADAIEPHSA
jgi:hypothetical protein